MSYKSRSVDAVTVKGNHGASFDATDTQNVVNPWCYTHREVVLENDRFSSVLLTRRKTQTMQRIGEAL